MPFSSLKAASSMSERENEEAERDVHRLIKIKTLANISSPDDTAHTDRAHPISRNPDAFPVEAKESIEATTIHAQKILGC